MEGKEMKKRNFNFQKRIWRRWFLKSFKSCDVVYNKKSNLGLLSSYSIVHSSLKVFSPSSSIAKLKVNSF